MKIYEYQPTMFHCKLMIIDRVWVSLGSSNMDNRSFRLNDEANLNVLDAKFAEEQVRVFEEDKGPAREITYEMWKRRPLVASAVGGIQDQVVDGTGILLADPGDLGAFGAAVRGLLDDPDRADRMGRAAHSHVHETFLGDRHLLRYAELFGKLLSRTGSR